MTNINDLKRDNHKARNQADEFYYSKEKEKNGARIGVQSAAAGAFGVAGAKIMNDAIKMEDPSHAVLVGAFGGMLIIFSAASIASLIKRNKKVTKAQRNNLKRRKSYAFDSQLAAKAKKRDEEKAQLKNMKKVLYIEDLRKQSKLK